MIRSTTVLLLAAGLLVMSGPGFAQTASPAPHHARKAAKHTAKSTPAPSAPGYGNINTPSTDFSNVERSGEDDAPSRNDNGAMRPVMGAGGNIGLGTGF